MHRLFLLVGLALAASCQSPQTKASGPPSDWPGVAFPDQGAEVAILLEPYFDRDRIRAEFGATCESSGAFPVRVAALNRGDATLILDTQRIALLLEGGEQQAEISVGTPEIDEGPALLRGTITMGATGALLGPLMELGFLRVDATQADARMSRHALRGATLGTGDVLEGFVYFFPEGSRPSAEVGGTLRLEFHHSGSSEIKLVEVPLASNP